MLSESLLFPVLREPTVPETDDLVTAVTDLTLEPLAAVSLALLLVSLAVVTVAPRETVTLFAPATVSVLTVPPMVTWTSLSSVLGSDSEGSEPVTLRSDWLPSVIRRDLPVESMKQTSRSPLLELREIAPSLER